MKKLFSIFALLTHLSMSNIGFSANVQPNVGYYTASWYGPGFHGRTTANGETYNMYSMTAAHKTLPFNTRLMLVNPINNKTVIVRINDRGPYIKGREIDLSYSAASALGVVDAGVLKLKVIKL